MISYDKLKFVVALAHLGLVSSLPSGSRCTKTSHSSGGCNAGCDVRTVLTCPGGYHCSSLSKCRNLASDADLVECSSPYGENGICCPTVTSSKLTINGFDRVRVKPRLIPTESRDSDCEAAIVCNEDDVYRSMDGTCNNLQQPAWGSSMRGLGRLAAPVYSDDDLGLRLSAKDGSELPSARLVSQKLATVVIGDSDKGDMSGHMMQWGQFLTHDLDHTPESMPSHLNDCCQDQYNSSVCSPISIAEDDPLYGLISKTCMNFVRSKLAVNKCTEDGQRDPLNIKTSFLDGSMIYGDSEEQCNELRTFQDGKKKRTPENLMLSATEGECAIDLDLCFKSGDKRLNEHPGLTLYHMIWMREHNRVAEALGELMPGVGDEKIFQEARRIVIAELQMITYNEFLPLILSEEDMRELSEDDVYDPALDATISNSFSTAAFRFGHSQVLNNLRFSSIGCPRREIDHLKLRDAFFNPSIIHVPNKCDEHISGLGDGAVRDPGAVFSASVSGQLSPHRESEAAGFGVIGLDLVALNIQRGRDHGLPGYNKFRDVCGLSVASGFADLSDMMTAEQISALRSVYSSVEDIDLFIAGLMEKHVPGGRLGPTFSCIIANQMKRLKNGDRFFFSLENSASGFSPAQLKEISKVSWARVMCDNSGVESMQARAMKRVSQSNPIVDCDRNIIERLDFSAWA